MDATCEPEDIVCVPDQPDSVALAEMLLGYTVKGCPNPHVTYETFVLRTIKRQVQDLKLAWSHIMETIRQGPCLMDEDLHRELLRLWNHRKRQVTLDEQHCVERVLGHDHNRVGDLIKLAGILNKISDPIDVYHFFAMDGFLGDDSKRYTESFRCNDIQYRHVRGVRELYRSGHVRHPAAMRAMLEALFEQGADNLQEYQETYVNTVGGWRVVKEIAEWRKELEEKGKKKRSADDDRPSKGLKFEE